MSEYIIQKNTLDRIANAINNKTGDSQKLTPAEMVEEINNKLVRPSGTKEILENGTFNVREYKKVLVDVPTEIESGVLFLSHDLSVVEAWKSEDVAAQTELPTNPLRVGFVAQGWTWTLEEIKAYIALHPTAKIYMRQMYKTTSGLTEVHITLNQSTGLRVTCRLAGEKHWGDGLSDSTQYHEYDSYGNYTITADCTTIRDYPFGPNNDIERAPVTAVYIGQNVVSIAGNAFRQCLNLKEVTVPQGVATIGNYAFYACRCLQDVVLPRGITSIGTSSLSETQLRSVTFPPTLTAIPDYMCYDAYVLENATIPEGVTTIGNSAFSTCYALSTAALPSTLTAIPQSLFEQCRSLKRIIIPSGVTTINSDAFSHAGLETIVLPSTLTTIGNSAFNTLYSLHTLSAMPNVAAIGTYSFQHNYNMRLFDFRGATAVPTCAADTFNGCSLQCRILVPPELYEEWIVATGWNSVATLIYTE